MFERVLEIGKDSSDGYLTESSRKARTVLDRYFKGNAEYNLYNTYRYI